MSGVNGASPRQAAVAEWQAHADAGRELTGNELAELFGRSASWGRSVAREARQHAAADSGNPQDNGTAGTDELSADMPTASECQAIGDGRHPAAGGWQTAVTALAVLAVALAAAWASASHLSTVARMAGEGTPWLLPVSVDGLLVASSMVLYRAHQDGRAAGVVPWLGLLLGIIGSVAGNVVAVNPALVDEGTVSVLVAAWPPLSLALSFELLLRQLRT